MENFPYIRIPNAIYGQNSIKFSTFVNTISFSIYPDIERKKGKRQKPFPNILQDKYIIQKTYIKIHSKTINYAEPGFFAY